MINNLDTDFLLFSPKTLDKFLEASCKSYNFVDVGDTSIVVESDNALTSGLYISSNFAGGAVNTPCETTRALYVIELSEA